MLWIQLTSSVACYWLQQKIIWTYHSVCKNKQENPVCIYVFTMKVYGTKSFWVDYRPIIGSANIYTVCKQ